MQNDPQHFRRVTGSEMKYLWAIASMCGRWCCGCTLIELIRIAGEGNAYHLRGVGFFVRKDVSIFP